MTDQTDIATSDAQSADTSGAPSNDRPPLIWDKPGPGSWQLDASHYEADCALLARRAIELGMDEGSRQGFDLVGAPLQRIEPKFVNGHFYYRMVPLVSGDKDLPTPPNPVLWLLTRIHPAFRRRAKLAKAALDNRIWNDELRDWENVHRPYLVEQCRRLGAIDPADLDEAALAEHLRELIDLVNHGSILHFRLHISDLGPIGLLLVRAKEWGLDQREVMTTLAGASPATSAPMTALSAIRDAASGHGPFTTLDEVRGASPEAARLLDAFLDEFGWRLTTGYDLQELTLAELPELVLNAINTGDDARHADDVTTSVHAAGQAAFDQLAAKLAPEDRPEFDRLVSDARGLYGLRDENGPLTYQWPAGLLRRGLVEAGNRLLASGRLGHHRQVFDLEADELTALLRGGDEPGPEQLAERLATRTYWKTQEAPAFLGPQDDPPPPWVLPAALGKLMNVVITVLELIESDGSGPNLDGIGIGTEPMVGTARVVTDELDALARMEPGDVLVAPFTVPTYNAVLATAGAVVVENGGLLCHAAVIAREYGIPGVVGVAGATKLITDGALVRVDPVAGTIRELTAE